MNSAMEMFFKDFERNSGRDQNGAEAPPFADVFLFAGPQGPQALQAGAVALALSARKKRFRDLGWQSTELISLREAAMTGPYVMAETEWQMTFAFGDRSPEQISVASTFIVYTGGNQPRIVFYLPQHDVMTILKDRGIGA